METRTLLAWLATAFEPRSEPLPPSSRNRYSDIDPTPEQIRVACAEIQATWSKREWVVRAGGDPEQSGWRVPCVRVEGLPGER